MVQVLCSTQLHPAEARCCTFSAVVSTLKNHLPLDKVSPITVSLKTWFFHQPWGSQVEFARWLCDIECSSPTILFLLYLCLSIYGF